MSKSKIEKKHFFQRLLYPLLAGDFAVDFEVHSPVLLLQLPLQGGPHDEADQQRWWQQGACRSIHV